MIRETDRFNGGTLLDVTIARERLAWKDRDHVVLPDRHLAWESYVDFPHDDPHRSEFNGPCDICGRPGVTWRASETDDPRHCIRCVGIVEDWFRWTVTIPLGIAFWNPWAWLIQIGAKWHETRSWGTSYRGWLAIYATKGFPQEAIDFCFTDPCRLYLRAHGLKAPNALPRGVCVAIARLADCIETHKLCPLQPEASFGNFQPTRFAWIFDDIRPLMEPVELDGVSACKQGLFPISADVQAALYARALPATNPIVPAEFIRQCWRPSVPHEQLWANYQADLIARHRRSAPTEKRG